MAEIVEVCEYRVKRLFRRSLEKEGTEFVTALELNTPDGHGSLRPELPWALPGPSADNPKGERTFQLSVTDESGADHVRPIVKSSGLGSFTWTETAKAPDVSAGLGVTTPHGFSVGPNIAIKPNASTTKDGVFIAAVDPEVTVELLLPGNGLDEYLSEYLRWMAGEPADQEGLDEIVSDLVSVSAGSDFEASIEPRQFHSDTLGWQDIALTIHAGESATFFAALRFTSDTGDTYVTDLVSASTLVEPASVELLAVALRDFRDWRWGTARPPGRGFYPFIWELPHEPPTESQGH